MRQDSTPASPSIGELFAAVENADVPQQGTSIPAGEEPSPMLLNEIETWWALTTDGEKGHIVEDDTVTREEDAYTAWYPHHTEKLAALVRMLDAANTPRSVLSEFLNSFGSEARMRLAAYADIPETVVDVLVEDSDETVRLTVMYRDNLTEENIHALLEGSTPFMRSSLLRRGARRHHIPLTAERLQMLWDNPYDPKHDRFVSENDSTGEDYRKEILCNDNCPENIIRSVINKFFSTHHLHPDAHPLFLNALGNAVHTPKTLDTYYHQLEKLAEKSVGEGSPSHATSRPYRLGMRTIAGHQNVSEETLRHIFFYRPPGRYTPRTAESLSSREPLIRRALGNPRCPPDLIEKEYFVPTCPTDNRMRLFVIVRNPATPSSVLRHIRDNYGMEPKIVQEARKALASRRETAP